MAACGSAVSVLTPNGRRQTVKVSPNTPLLQVLEDVCQKHGFNPEDHGLKFQRTVVDLTLPWRFANLPNNAKLEMVTSTKKQADSQVRIALQMEDGSRQQGSFSSGQSLWELLTHFPQIRLSELSESGSTPVCVYMRDEVSGEEALKKATLKSLGLTGGSAIVRFLLKKKKTPEKEGGSDATPTLPVAKETPSISSSSSCQPNPSPPGPSASESYPNTSTRTSTAPLAPTPAPPTAPPPASTPAPPPDSILAPPPAPPPASAQAPPCKDTDSQDSVRPVDPPLGGQRAEDREEAGPSGLNCHPSSFTSAPFIPFSGGGQRLGGPGGGAAGRSSSFSSTSPQLAAPVESPKAKKAKPSPGSASKCKAATNLQDEGMDRGDEFLEPVDREALLYHLDSISHQPQDQQVLPDEFFEVTVDDVRKRFAQLKSDRRLLEEAPLLTKSQRESQMKEKIDRYPKVVLRVQFPDRHVLQGFFRPLETVGAVRNFVRSHLDDPQLSFYLFVAPPKTILDDPSVSLFQANLFPGALVYFGSSVPTDSYIKREMIQTSVSASQANQSIASSMLCAPLSSSLSSSSSSFSPPPPPPPSESILSTERSSQGQRDPDTHPQTDKPRTEPGKVPKWLKLPGKK